MSSTSHTALFFFLFPFLRVLTYCLAMSGDLPKEKKTKKFGSKNKAMEPEAIENRPILEKDDGKPCS